MESSLSVVVTKFGGYDSVSLKESSLPPLEGLIEVQVLYGGVNFADIYSRQGLIKRPLPFILGIECVGIITNIDKSLKTTLNIGNRVICYDYMGGMYREKIRLPPEKCYLIPNDNITDEDAATLFVNYLTAYFSLKIGNLQPNEKILISSCVGGVGIACTQLAKIIDGVEIYGTLSVGKENHAKLNGVHYPIIYENLENLHSIGFDLIISNQSGSVYKFLQSLLNPLGRIILIGANNLIENENKSDTNYIETESLIMNNRVVAGLHLGLLIEKNSQLVREALNKIFSYYNEGLIKPKIYSIIPMENVVESMKSLADRKNIGKVLIKINKGNLI